MKKFFQFLKPLIVSILLIFLLLTLSRLIFYIFHYNSFSSFTLPETLICFLGGIRFDAWSIWALFLPFFLLILLPGKMRTNKIYKKVISVLFIIGIFLISLPNFIDIEYIKFTGKRSTFDLFHLISTGDDTFTLIPIFIKDFWHLLLIWIALNLMTFMGFKKWVMPKITHFALNRYFLLVFSIFILIFASFSVIILRGTSYRPISINTATLYGRSDGANLILNSTFTILNTFDKLHLETKSYYSEKELNSIFNPITFTGQNRKLEKKNIVILIVESLSNEYSTFYNDSVGYTPFLDSLFSVGLTSKKSYANGKKSAEVLPSILISLPNLSNQPYAFSQYSGNNVYSLAHVLKKNGYSASFYHGGKNGTMAFDAFTKVCGIDEYYGLNEYPNKEHYDGSWGIPDMPYLQYVSNEISKKPTPFFTTIFTLSSHHPYYVPDSLQSILPKGTLPIHQSMTYADLSLKYFFETAKKQSWYNNTLFIITGDHTSLTEGGYFDTQTETFGVPICFFAPNDSLLTVITDKSLQHTDIFPTVIDYLGIKDTLICFGTSIFSEKPRFIVNYLSEIYWIYYNGLYLTFNGDSSTSLFYYPKIRKKSKNLLLLQAKKASEMETVLKAFIQQYNNRVSQNKLIINQ